ncbi:glutamate--tRNA ligase MSE1 [Sugiyamaella lignohabitans]|uniref:Glutamate--tRNA ligase, mitochondrial n=1 Tax=Sugiyamaella lignohabitans TaxID=796027 RepID=A0A167E2C9_9ASCO|nr:glutamate--tRNA ligase MSE1 [Sugiyamaella lignohabitans]ANB13562.1 glutamate--tRNA ligase MSE1 [Sugiyamaella lignohabitans]
MLRGKMPSGAFRRFLSTSAIRSAKRAPKPFSLKSHNKLSENQTTPASPINDTNISTTAPARTRFAPSPTGFIHLGSLRTALYNYLLAKSTGGQFLLRLEDTDRKRLVPGAEENIYESLKWTGLNWDEGPVVGGPYGPYKQSERSGIYAKYVEQLLDSGDAYRCFCSRERLDSLSSSARKLHPPSMASYDRKCSHLSREESDDKAHNGNPFTIRLKSPSVYPEFDDILHGTLSLQTQVNYSDIRYDDPVLVKSDGLPTYHFANVIDDYLMKITHVIRGEEWLASTPKHMALYTALGWKAPKFIHIPLLTSLSDKKLSKRSGDRGILSMGDSGILPEALVNFVALFGWSPPRESVGVTISELFTLQDLVEKFNLDGLTKGNAKVDDKKLMFFNSHYFRERLADKTKLNSIVQECHSMQMELVKNQQADLDTSVLSEEYTAKVLEAFGTKNLTSVQDFVNRSSYFYIQPWQSDTAVKALKELQADTYAKDISAEFLRLLDQENLPDSWAESICKEITSSNKWTKKQIFSVLRYTLAGGVSGVTIPKIMTILGPNVTKLRATEALSKL